MTGAADVVTYSIPLKVISVANTSEHWSARRRRVKREQNAGLVVRRHPLPCTVTLIRLYPTQGRGSGQVLDDDNLRSAFKALRDSVAARLGVDDADPRVAWAYDQEPLDGRAWAVRVEIARIDESAGG